MPDNTEFKKVVASADIGSNYLYHVFAVCRINFDSQYADKHRDSVNSNDVNLMRSLSALLSFGGGLGGALVDFVIAGPLYRGFESDDEFREYYSRLDEALRDGCYDSFIERYELGEKHQAPWFEMEPRDLEVVKEHRRTLQDIGRVFRDNFATYATHIWPQEKSKLESIAAIVENHFSGSKVIGAWESLTQITFKRPEFRAVLCSAIANGPNANSFAYDKVVFYHETPIPKLLDLIVHEVGTHILVEPFKKILDSGAYNRRDLFHAYECIASYFTSSIVGRPLHYDLAAFRQEMFDLRIGHILEQTPSISVDDLLIELTKSCSK